MTETWLPCVELQNLYEVSNLGGFRSLRSGKKVKARPNPDGYLIVTISINGARFTKKLHRLVCRAFNGPGNPLHREVAHMDGSRTNCRAANLKWVSPAENCSHKRIHGTHQSGDKHPRALLSEAGVRLIREVKGRRTAAELATQFGVSRHTIYDVWQNKNWRSPARAHGGGA